MGFALGSSALSRNHRLRTSHVAIAFESGHTIDRPRSAFKIARINCQTGQGDTGIEELF